MNPAQPRQFFIQGQTLDGRTFRPSDWAERLAGAMSCFRPGGTKGGIGSFIGYSPYCVPRLINTLCDTALMAAYASNREQVTLEDIRQAIAEM